MTQTSAHVRSRAGWRHACALALPVLLLVAGCSRDPNARKQQFFESGNSYFEQAKYEEAAVEYRNAIQIDSAFAQARLKLAESYARMGNVPLALQEYVRAADLLPADSDLQLTAARYLLAAGKADDALARVDGVLKRHPDNIAAHVLRGNALGGLNDLENALAEIEEAIRLDPSEGTTFTQLGLVQMALGRRQEAETAFQRAVTLAPDSVGSHLALGQYYWASNRQDEAERSFRRALELEPANGLANRAMAIFSLATGKTVEAESYLKAVADASPSSRAVFTLTDYYLATGRPQAAVERLRRLAGAGRRLPGLHARLAQAEAAAGNGPAAHRILDELLKQNPHDAEAHALKGQLLLKEGQRERALASLRSAAEADPGSAMVQFALGRVYAARGDNAGAEKAFREVLRLNPRASAARAELAKLELAAGRVESAVRSAEEAIQHEPANLGARVSLIRGLIASKDFARAEREIAALLAEHSRTAAVHVQSGALAAERGDLKTARGAFDQALALEPASLEAFAGLLSVDLRERNADAVRLRLSNRLGQPNASPQLLLIAGRAYASINELASAERVLRQAIEAEPTLLPAYMMLGQIYLKQRKLAQARQEFESLAARQSRPIGALTMVGMIHYAEGNMRDARKRFEQVLAHDPGAAVAANNLAWIYAQSGENLESALQLAQRATATVPNSAEMLDTLGWVYFKKGQPDLAIPAFSRAVQADGKNPTYHYHLGLAHARSGDAKQARAALERALSLDANFQGAQDARRALAALPEGDTR
jgi:tetratricopeptide (TPR) repeat protein